jgi:amino acid transporter
MNYILLFIAFIKLRLDHKKMARQFVNPLGIPSAVVGIGCMLAATVSLFTHAPLIT